MFRAPPPLSSGSDPASSWGHGGAGDRASSPRAAVARPAHAADVPAAKPNKHTKITALAFPPCASVRFNFGNLALDCSKVTRGEKGGDTDLLLARPNLCRTAFGVLCPLSGSPPGVLCPYLARRGCAPGTACPGSPASTPPPPSPPSSAPS